MDGLEIWEGLVLSTEVVVGAGRALEGVEARDDVGRAGGVEGLDTVGVRVIGEDGLMYDETEAELVLRIDEDRFEE